MSNTFNIYIDEKIYENCIRHEYNIDTEIANLKYKLNQKTKE